MEEKNDRLLASQAEPELQCYSAGMTRKELREKKRSRGSIKPGILKKTINLAGNIIFFIMLLVMCILVFAMVQSNLTGGPPGLAGYQMYIVQGGSMSPAFEPGSLAFLRPADTRSLRTGDIITYGSADSGKTLTTHRVVAVNSEDGRLSFTTRGDANQVNDHLPVYPENIVGRVVYTVPYAGYLMSFGQTKTGIIALVFIPGALVIFFEVRNLFRLAAEWEEEKERKKKAGKNFLSGEA